jgi:hypothetical protein
MITDYKTVSFCRNLWLCLLCRPAWSNRKRSRYYTDFLDTENKSARNNLRLYGGNTDSIILVNIVA